MYLCQVLHNLWLNAIATTCEYWQILFASKKFHELKFLDKFRFIQAVLPLCLRDEGWLHLLMLNNTILKYPKLILAAQPAAPPATNDPFGDSFASMTVQERHRFNQSKN